MKRALLGLLVVLLGLAVGLGRVVPEVDEHRVLLVLVAVPHHGPFERLLALHPYEVPEILAIR